MGPLGAKGERYPLCYAPPTQNVLEEVHLYLRCEKDILTEKPCCVAWVSHNIHNSS